MERLRRWSWLVLPFLAILAIAWPAVLQARQVTPVVPTVAQSEYNWADERDPPHTAPRAVRWTSKSESSHEASEIENLALCAATGFAGGFTLFLCVSGWGIFRNVLPKDFAVGALVFSTAASAGGFLLGFNGFLQLVSY